MSGDRFTHVRYPWKAVIGRNSDVPARFYVDLVAQAERNGIPARRPLPLIRAPLARRGFPSAPLRYLLRALPGRPRPDLTDLLNEIRDRWPEVTRRAAAAGLDLPSRLERPSLLSLDRTSAQTVFVFSQAPYPLIVLKVPRAGHPGVEREIAALRAVEDLRIAPRYFGSFGRIHLQEGLRGQILSARTFDDPARVDVLPAHEELGRALVRLAASTVTRGRPKELRPEMLEAVVGSTSLPGPVRKAVSVAWATLAALDVRVLKHTDASPMNCIVDGDRLVGLVDWEISTFEGAPGFDLLNAGLAHFEHSLGLTRWSDRAVVEAFRVAWSRAPFFRFWRAATEETGHTLGLSDEVVRSLVVAFFAWRVGLRVMRPENFAYGPETAARMLEIVCAS